MKVIVSCLSVSLLGVALNVAALLVPAGVSARLASVSASSPQGAGRPTPKPKSTQAGGVKRHHPRPRPKAAAGGANKVNNAARHGVDLNVGAKNNNTPRRSAPALDADANTGAVNDNTGTALKPELKPEDSREVRAPANNNSDERTIPSESNTAGPAAESKTQPATAATPPMSKTPEKASPDADILLPDGLRKLESSPRINISRPASDEQTLHPPGLRSKPGKLFNATGALSEIADRHKVFVNIRGEYGDRITARLKAYGRLEVVKTAVEADFAVSYYDWADDERDVGPTTSLGVWDEGTKAVTGGTLIVTIRDPSERMPRVIWRNDDTDGGRLKRGDAIDKLSKRFINELKRLRGGR
jgi:hypothetical protein